MHTEDYEYLYRLEEEFWWFAGMREITASLLDDFCEAETLAQAKQLMRMLINHYLGGQALSSRRVFKELQAL